MTTRSHQPLAESLAALLSEKRADHYGNWAWAPFYAELEALHVPNPNRHGNIYRAGAIRPLIEGRAKPSIAILEAMARLLDVDPDYFLEYRLGRLDELQRAKPDLVDLLYDIAMAEEESQKSLKR
jgi:transcriptional regulator with XRE-family HTH domain